MKIINGSKAIILYNSDGFQIYYQAPYTVSDNDLLGAVQILNQMLRGRTPNDLGIFTQSSYELEQIKSVKAEKFLYDSIDEAADVIHKDYREGEQRRQEEIQAEYEKNKALKEIGPLREENEHLKDQITRAHARIIELEQFEARSKELEDALSQSVETIQNMKDTFNSICKQFRIGKDKDGNFVQY